VGYEGRPGEPRHAEARGDSPWEKAIHLERDTRSDVGIGRSEAAGERADGLRASAHGPDGQPSHAVPPITRLPHLALFPHIGGHMRTRGAAPFAAVRRARSGLAGSASAPFRAAPQLFDLRGETPSC